MFRKIAILGLGLLLGVAASVQAQEKPPADDMLVPLKLQLVLSRYQGDKKVASMPYTLWVTALSAAASRDSSVARTRPVQLQTGVNVPVPVVRMEQDKGPVTTWNYQRLGTQIDVPSAYALQNGRFRIELSVSHSALYTDEEAKATQKSMATARVADQPLLTNFTSAFSILLRDGETGQYISATDPVTGQVLKVDATLTMLK